MNELYDALLATTAAVGISMVSRKVTGVSLGTPDSVKGTLKLALAIGSGAMIVKWGQQKKYIPVDPFKG